MAKKAHFLMRDVQEWMGAGDPALEAHAITQIVAFCAQRACAATSQRDVIMNGCPCSATVRRFEQEGGFRGDSTNGPADGV